MKFASKYTIAKEVESLLAEMANTKHGSDEYSQLADELIKLMEAGSFKSSSFLKWEMILPIVANIAGILLVLNYEKLDIISSKAFGMIRNRF